MHGLVHLGDDMIPCWKYIDGYIDICFGICHGYVGTWLRYTLDIL
jgi:hypothetical protein